jgi:hypothetical protein
MAGDVTRSWSAHERSSCAPHQVIRAFDCSPWRRSCFETMYVLFPIYLGSAVCTFSASPRTRTPAWVTQQAHDLAVGEELTRIRFLIRDRDSKLSGPFDEVFAARG